MPLTIVVTRNVADRFRGFLASVMLELSPGVYVSPYMRKAVRERIWAVCENWHSHIGEGSVLMVWRNEAKPGGLAILALGEPPKEIVDHEGVLMVRSPLSPALKKKLVDPDETALE